MRNDRKILEELMKEHETVNTGMIMCKVIQRMCDDYCKYPDLCREQAKDQDEAADYLLDHYCIECPMNLLQ